MDVRRYRTYAKEFKLEALESSNAAARVLGKSNVNWVSPRD